MPKIEKPVISDLNAINSTPQGVGYWENRKKEDKGRDWQTGDKGWIESYWDSQTHPHRQLILKALEKIYPFHNLLEVGCSAGPNLNLIKEKWPEVDLVGIDPNVDSIEFARGKLPEANLFVFNVLTMPFAPRQFDVILCDSSLMYVSPANIAEAMDNINDIADRAIVICDWRSASKEGVVKDGHWARDYGKWLKGYGFSVEEIKLNKEDWPTSEKWVEHGYLWICQR